MATATFSPGFRLSSLDVAVLIVGSAAVAGLATVAWQYALALGIVLIHFFLFCNVLRASRTLELAWAGIFVVLAAATIWWDMPGWPLTAAASVGVAAIVAAAEMRKPSYHGVGWRRINPGLRDWWDAQNAGGKEV